MIGWNDATAMNSATLENRWNVNGELLLLR